MKRIVTIIVSVLFFIHVVEAQLLPATVKKPTPPPVQKPISKPIPKPSVKPVVTQKENAVEQKPVVRKRTIELPAGPENFNFNNNYVLFEDFSSNVNNWTLFNNSATREEISNGRFLFNTKTEKGTYHTNLTFGFDNNQDFSVSVKMKWQDGANNYGYGMNFCSSYKDNSYYIFYISSNGYYKIAYSEKNGSWKDLKAWTTSSVVNKGIVSNIIEVRHVGRYMEFYINEKMIERIPFEQPFGNDFGFRVDDKQTVEFDDLLVQGKSMLDNLVISSDEDALLEIGSAKAPLRKDEPFVASIPKGLYNVSVTNAGDADEKSTFILNARGQRDVINKAVQFKSRQTLKELAQHSKVVLVPVMDQATTLWGFKDSATGKFLVPYQYDWADSMFDGMAIVNRGKRFGFINQLGEEIIPIKQGLVSRFYNGFSRVKNGEKYEMMSMNGNILNGSSSAYSLSYVQRGVLILPVANADKVKYGAINIKGEIIIPSVYDRIDPFVEEVSAFSLNSKVGLINLRGEQVVKPIYDAILRFTDGLAPARINAKSGYLDKMGNTAIPFQYDRVSVFNCGRAYVLQNNKYSLIDKTGLPVSRNTYAAINVFEENLASVMVGTKWGMIDLNGNWIIPPKYDSLGTSVNEGIIPAKMGTKWGAIDKDGNVTVLYKFDKLENFSTGMAAACLSNKWGFINSSGYEIVPLKYDGAGSFFNGMAWVRSGSRYFYIDKTGKLLTD